MTRQTCKKRVRKHEKVVFTRIYKKDLEVFETLMPNMDNTDRIRSVYNNSWHCSENFLRKIDEKLSKYIFKKPKQLK